MTNLEKILKLAKENNGYVTTKDIVKINIAKVYLTQAVENGLLIRVSRGLYMLSDYFEDEYYKIQISNSKAIFSHETALYLLGINERIPTIYNISVPRNYGGNLLKRNDVKLFYVNNDILDLGVTIISSPSGHNIRVYNLERCICDIIKNKKDIDLEIFVKILKFYANCNTRNLNNLFEYAKKLKIEDEVRKYMEVL